MEKKDLIKKKKDVIDGMLEYLNEYGGEGYKKSDVSKVGKVLDKYFSNMEKESKRIDKSFQTIVKETVFNLNKLNENCDGSMIETDQREGICDFMINTAMFFKFIAEFKDVTEEWREW